jgi:RimJ/RimL family protein N-acetyltransferase
MDVGIRGDHVVLRRLTMDDVDAVYRACQDADTQRFTAVPVPYTRDCAVEFIEGNLTCDWNTTDSAVFAISRVGKAGFDGSISLRLDGGGGASVGFAVAPWARRQGVATGGLRAICLWAFSERDVRRVEWEAVVGNVGSRKVAESVGFQIEGICRKRIVLRGVRYDGWLASLLREDLHVGGR